MSGSVASQGVTKLKELLFETEAERLSDLSRRLEALGKAQDDLRGNLAERKAYEEGARAELSRRIDGIHDRVGSTESLTRSVSEVLDGAIVRNERERHDDLQTALAPVVVNTVKTEIANSQDALVEALYPMTGQMVKAYVASAMKDLVNQVNRRLESNALMLRIKSLTTGRSMAELALAESQRLEVEELLLIRRGTGELVARWPERPGRANQDHVMGGVLSAINSFATEALEEGENTLRQIDLGAAQVYLRSSPGYLLAAKCSGTAGVSIEQAIDDEFLETVTGLHDDDGAASEATGRLSTLGPRITRRIAEHYEAIDRPALGVSPVKLLAIFVGLPLLAWFAWSSYISYETNRVRQTARAIIETSPEIKGYPTTLHVAPRGRQLSISGLAPTEPALQAVLDRLGAALPDTAIDNHVSVVPQGARDATPDIAALRKSLQAELARVDARIPRQAALSALLRARVDLDAGRSALHQLKTVSAKDATKRGQDISGGATSLLTEVDKAMVATLDALKALETPLPTPANAEPDGIAKRLLDPAVDLSKQSRMLAQQAGVTTLSPAAKPIPGSGSAQYLAASEYMESVAGDARLLAAAILQGELVRAAIPELPPPPVIPGPTARDRLVDFIRSNAVFFADTIDYRDDALTNATLDTLAKLIRETDVFVRVVGYTDERGTVTRNTSLSQLRADKVRDALIARGIPASRLIAVGRLSLIDISPAAGPRSPNRRVEFEIGFKGEAPP